MRFSLMYLHILYTHFGVPENVKDWFRFSERKIRALSYFSVLTSFRKWEVVGVSEYSEMYKPQFEKNNTEKEWHYL